jgi:squalene synthase HpnC
MSTAADFASGKGSGDENFPVASFLIPARHRPVIMAFYRFARAADDIADHAGLDADTKLRLLDRMEASLDGRTADPDPDAAPLARALAERGLSSRHAVDLLNAFRQDAVKRRYDDWDDLIAYCTLSAMPVGRFVLDVHGEPRDTWPASDALCAALQVINHLQDCAKDYRALDRVYLPLDSLAAAGADVSMLALPAAPPPLRTCLADLTRRTAGLMQQALPLPGQCRSFGLELETAVIIRAAQAILRLLAARDPLSQRVHLSAPAVAGTLLGAVAARGARRLNPFRSRPQ